MFNIKEAMTAVKLRRLYYQLSLKWNNDKKKRAQAILDAWHDSHYHYHKKWQDWEYLVVDSETSSLSAKNGEMLSIGWVVVKGGKVKLDSAEHYFVKARRGVGDSATIHQIRDCELDEALTKEEIMNNFLRAATDRILIFHHAPLDMAFLNKISRAVYGIPLLWPVVDTLQAEKYRLEKRQIPIGQAVLRLASCRARYNLPSYPAHNALVDALATAELFLAQMETA